MYSASSLYVVVIELPVADYDRFLEKLHEHSCPESAIVSRASYIRRPNCDRYLRSMQFKCDLVQARRLLRLSSELWPPAANAIQRAIEPAIEIN